MNAPPLVVVPELFRSTGGVQNFSRCFIEALDDIYQEQVPVISLLDQSVDLPDSFSEQRWVTACGSISSLNRKLRFLSAIASAPTTSATFSTHPNPAPLFALQKRVIGRRFLSVAHGIDVWNMPYFLQSSLSLADIILPVSTFTKDSVQTQLGQKTPPLRILNNTVDKSRFYPAVPQTQWREKLDIAQRAPVILTVTRLSKSEMNKGYDIILNSLPTLLKNFPSLIWILGGKGDDLPRIKRQAANLGVASACRFPGFIPDVDLADLYRSANLFVLPSRKEGFGIVFIEAAACGLPLIAGNEDGSVDALAQGQLGTLICPTNEEALAQAIETQLGELQRHDSVAQHEHCTKLFGFPRFKANLRNYLTEHGFI